jgi:hypothetical protein
MAVRPPQNGWLREMKPRDYRIKKRRRARGRGAGATPRQRVWLESPRGRAQQQALARSGLVSRRKAVRCGARRKSDGQPCRLLPASGKSRCRLHGGATPGGDQFHVVQWPDDPVKRARKEVQIARRRAQLRERLAKMTVAERERFEAWHRARKPGSAAARARARQDREAMKLFTKSSPRPINPEITRLEAQLKAIRLENERLKEIAEAEIVETVDENVFD